MTKIGIMMGDDIGYEVVPECVKVMRAATARTGFEIAWEIYPIGKEGHDLHGDTTPAVTVEGLKSCDGFIMGPIGHSAYPRNDPTWIMPPIRKLFDLFASVKPVKSYSGITSVHEDVDIVFLREVTEGMQSWDTTANGNAEYMPNKDTAIGARVITREGSRRVAKEAFEIATTRPRKKVTAAHKEGVYRMTCGLFVEECRALAEQYPDVEYNEFNIDTICAHLVMEPQQFDVIVTTNQFGDILTDLGAGLVGGLGLAPGLCVGHTQAMPQATHGSAPDIAGHNIANPYALIMSGQMLLDWLGRKKNEPKATEAAALIAAAMDQVIKEAKHLTRDLGGGASTTEMGDAVVEAIG